MVDSRASVSGLLWATLIVVCGLLFGAVSVTHIHGEPFTGILLGTLPPLVLSGCIVGTGVLMARTEYWKGYHQRVATWMLLGMAAGLVGILVLIQYELAHGVQLVHVNHVVINTLVGGASGGLVIGFYDMRRKQTAERHAVTSQILNTVRQVNQQLLRTETEAALKADVCETLTSDAPYDLAWFGEADADTEKISPATAAGADQSYVDGLVIDLTDEQDARGPTATAFETNEVQAVQRIERDSSYQPWREPALEHGFRSSIAIPVSYDERMYGVLNVYSGRDEAFGQREQRVLGQLGESIAYAIYTLEIERQQEAQYRELQRTNDQLEKFASVVSHDLRNPLNVAKLHTELVQETEDLSHVDDIAAAHERLEAIIEDTLSLARDGRVVEDLQPVDLDSIVEESWDSVATEGATLDVRDSCDIQADPSRLQQLLENLIRNSVDHGATTISVGPIHDTTGTVDDSGGDSRNGPSGFYVEDDGPGIPEDERDAVFEVGYTTSDDGTGFGLSIVEEIAHAHEWDITVTEGRMGGARFEITGIEN